MTVDFNPLTPTLSSRRGSLLPEIDGIEFKGTVLNLEQYLLSIPVPYI